MSGRLEMSGRNTAGGYRSTPLKSLCCGSRLTQWWKEGISPLWEKAFGEISTISPSGSADVLITVSV